MFSQQNRIEEILIKDKKLNPEKITPLVKSDICSILENYFNLENLEIKISLEQDTYVINFLAKANKIKCINLLA